MNFVTTQHSSNKLGSVFAAPKFSDVRFLVSLHAKRINRNRQEIEMITAPCFYIG